MSVQAQGQGKRQHGVLLGTVLALVMATVSVVGGRTATATEPVFIHVSTTGDWIEFFNFPVDESVDVYVDDAWVDAVVMEEPDRFAAGLDFDFQAGQTVRAEHESLSLMAEVDLVDLSITLEEFDAFGSGPADTTLQVEALGSLCPYGEGSSQEVVTDGAGDWGASYETACPDGFGDDVYGSVFHFDAEGDATIAETVSDEPEPEPEPRGPQIPHVGDQLWILFVEEAEYPADTAFHVRHGWMPEEGDRNDVLHRYEFQLFVDGNEIHGAREVLMDKGQWIGAARVMNFRDGLPADTYEFVGVWTSPAYPPEDPFIQRVLVTFTE